jgi:peptidoglycan/xylan/chitin deacetylase (PgdA/CDA1 family)
MARFDRRTFIRGGALAAGGAGAALVAPKITRLFEPDRLPLGGGYAPADDHTNMIKSGRVSVTWFAPTTAKLVALTFDDGPSPHWTPMVLDQLDEVEAPATFFMIGQHLRDQRGLVQKRMGRHEIGNHTWTHPDLAELDLGGVLRELAQSHEQIVEVFKRAPTMMRPPYGHLGGSTVLAASHMNYDVVLWDTQMHPGNFRDDTGAQTAAIVDCVRPGSIVLAHDAGLADRLGGLKGIADIVRGLRAKGYQLVTVSELLSAAAPTTKM